MRTLRAICLLVGLTAFAGSGTTDQTDPRLGSLFKQLKAASEPSAAVSIERQIWAIWLDHSDPAIQALMQSGVSAMNAGNHRAALETFDRVVTRAPDFAEGWNKRATLHYFMGNLGKSLADIEATLRLEPRHFGALSGRGLVYVKLGDLERALAAFEDALEVSPQSAGLRTNAEAIRALLGQRET